MHGHVHSVSRSACEGSNDELTKPGVKTGPHTPGKLLQDLSISEVCFSHAAFAVREFIDKSAASAALLDYIEFQAVIKSAARAASLETRKNLNNPRKNREKMKESLRFWAFYTGRRPPAEAVVLHSPGASFPGFGSLR